MQAFWNKLVVVPHERPRSPNQTRLWLWCAASILAGVLFCLLAPAQMRAPDTDPFFAPSLAWLLACVVRAAFVIALALWIGLRRPGKGASPIEQRQGRIGATIVLIILAAVGVVMWLEPAFYSAPLLVLYYLNLLLIHTQVYWFIRRGLVRGGIGLLLGNAVLQVAATVGATNVLSAITSVLVPAIIVLTSGLLIRWWLGLVLAFSLPLLIGLVTAVQRPLEQQRIITLLTFIIFLFIIAGVVALYARSLEAALETADARTTEVAAARAALEQQNVYLQQQTLRLEQSERALRALVDTLEVVVVPLADGILLAPLLGTLDERRMAKLTTRLLHEVAARRTRTLILDIAGVKQADAPTAQALLQTARALRLLGCTVALTGIAPAAALTFTRLGLTFDDLTIAHSPQQIIAAI